MRQITGNLFNPKSYSPQIPKPDVVCITTNGAIKKDGTAVMGRGCAKEAAKLIPTLPRILAQKILSNGNRPNILLKRPGKSILVSFPVKPVSLIIKEEEDFDKVLSQHVEKFRGKKSVPGWACYSDLNLILESAKILKQMADIYNWKTVVLPRPGCGNGGLDWNKVEKKLSKILDDRFFVITWR